tara:strand:- start:26 stop:760 length:735 start_codon:yes stop_codon:yes gene_type:complete
MKSKSDINSLVKEFSNLNKSYDSLLVDAIPFENIINKKIPVIYANNEIIKKNTKSIELENILKKFPPQAIGSVSLYNQFNHKANEFDTEQQQALTRFIILIENTEKRYREQYLTVTTKYLSHPFKSGINELQNIFLTLANYFTLLKSLIDESTGDTVLFNKVYTNLEDSGLFMSVPEKKQLEYLKEMVELHKELLNKLDKLNLKLNKLQGDINYSLSMLDSLETELWDVASGLDDVSLEIDINK